MSELTRGGDTDRAMEQSPAAQVLVVNRVKVPTVHCHGLERRSDYGDDDEADPSPRGAARQQLVHRELGRNRMRASGAVASVSLSSFFFPA